MIGKPCVAEQPFIPKAYYRVEEFKSLKPEQKLILLDRITTARLRHPKKAKMHDEYFELDIGLEKEKWTETLEDISSKE
jgi:hypothetical protein